jgi:hypothetical protein
MKRPLAHALSVIALVAAAASPAIAQDYQCKQAAGCTAQKPSNGSLKRVKFKKGDLISTDDGWVVNPDDGWKKVRSKNKANAV